MEDKWAAKPDVMNKIIPELKEALGQTCKIWMLFMSPTKKYARFHTSYSLWMMYPFSINGVQDTVIRALILAKSFQTEVFNIIYKYLDVIAKSSSPSPQQLEVGDKIILQLRYITQIFNPTAISAVVFDKKIEHWNSILREKFIDIIPELFTDNSVHSSK